MLDHILACAQAFQREHGLQPNVVYINPDHHKALLVLYPSLFDNDPQLAVGSTADHRPQRRTDPSAGGACRPAVGLRLTLLQSRPAPRQTFGPRTPMTPGLDLDVWTIIGAIRRAIGALR